MSLASGVRLGPYEIVALLGAGGMGEVYRARDTRLDRDRRNQESCPKPSRRIRSSVSASTAKHARSRSSIIRTSARSTTSASRMVPTYLVMEYLEGETLARRLERGGLPLDEALTIAIQIARRSTRRTAPASSIAT